MEAEASQQSTADIATIQSGYIVSPWYDNIFFIFSPLLSLIIGIIISNTWFSSHDGTRLDGNSYAALCLGTFLMGHFVIGFFRAYGNPKIFAAYPYRVTVIPLALFAGMLYSEPVLYACLIISTLWDEWHSGQQTFGFCRIYDGKVKNDALTGRKLDMGINALIWFGPMIGGVTLMEHVLDIGNDVKRFANTSASDPSIFDIFFSAIPAQASANTALITQCVIALAIPFLLYYIYFYYREWKNGYQISSQKITLLVVTAIVSIYTWGFNSFGEAYLIMNAFHYLQYYGLIWYLEKKNIKKSLGVKKEYKGDIITAVIFVVLSLAAGYFLFIIELRTHELAAIFTTISMMHFWFDSFIFSVRKKQV